MNQANLRHGTSAVSLILLVSALLVAQDSWKTNEEAAARAAKAVRFSEAEKLLLTNSKFADALALKDPRRPRTLFDLAEVYRAEGKYSDALPLYDVLFRSTPGSMALKPPRPPMC